MIFSKGIAIIFCCYNFIRISAWWSFCCVHITRNSMYFSFFPIIWSGVSGPLVVSCVLDLMLMFLHRYLRISVMRLPLNHRFLSFYSHFVHKHVTCTYCLRNFLWIWFFSAGIIFLAIFPKSYFSKYYVIFGFLFLRLTH